MRGTSGPWPLLVGYGGQKIKEFCIREIVVVFGIIGAKPVYQRARQVEMPTRIWVFA